MDKAELKEILLKRLNNPANPLGYSDARAAELKTIIWKELGINVDQADIKTVLDELRAGNFDGGEFEEE